MSLTQYYTATTLDGFIADPDNSLELAVHPQARGRRAVELRRVHRRRRSARNGVDDVRMDPRPRVRGQGLRRTGAGRTRSRAGSSRTGSCRSCPTRGSSSRARTSRPCTTRWSPPRVTGTSGSSAEATWSVSSPTWGCWTRSSCRSHRSRWGGRAAAAAPDRAAPGRAGPERRFRVREVLRRAPAPLSRDGR